ncbi:MAG TPA: hypothetical protein VE871_03150 [Longimicrobium sp.]|nr:hypothetical protein [Longimicrobium sp.]
MRKIRLMLDALAVESFQTAKVSEHHGTVQGHGASFVEKCLATGVASCPRAMTQDWSCVYACECTDAQYECS